MLSAAPTAEIPSSHSYHRVAEHNVHFCRGTLTRAKRSQPTSGLDNSSSDQLHILPGGGIQIQHGIRKVAGELQRTQPHVYSTKSAVIVFTGYLSNLSELLDRCQLQDSIPEPRSPIFRNTPTSELTCFAQTYPTNPQLDGKQF